MTGNGVVGAMALLVLVGFGLVAGYRDRVWHLTDRTARLYGNRHVGTEPPQSCPPSE